MQHLISPGYIMSLYLYATRTHILADPPGGPPWRCGRLPISNLACLKWPPHYVGKGARLSTGRSIPEPCWFLIYTQPSREFVAADFLDDFKFIIYFPRVRNLKNKNGSPFLARYIFALEGTGNRDLGPIPGVAQFLKLGSYPMLVRQDVINKMKAREDSDGYIIISEPVVRSLHNGDHCKVIDEDGIDEWDAIFCRMRSQHRAELFLAQLGKHRITVPLARVRLV